ncbi:uncharacterized protein LOC122520485 [Polistes fuscatus]|uniref:uncharacterized protein LOC122520485 n=1 Tax=Polistes fuscatus TaxID=30207 RepID=UPI001CA930E7|nr:uncharacterized protein LOC122520485 [Polistes fuscatus]
MALPRIKERSSGSLHKIINIVTSSLSALETLGCSVDQWDHILVHQVGLALDDKTREDWETRLGTSREFPPLEQLLSHLTSTARALEHIETPPTRSYARALNIKVSATTPASTSQSSGSSQLKMDERTIKKHPMPFIDDLSNTCTYCSHRHYIAFCPLFKHLSQHKKEKVIAEYRLCYNCLGRYNVRQCRSNRRCNECGDRHHTLIHLEKRTSPSSRTSPPSPRTSPPSPRTSPPKSRSSLPISRSSSTLSETTQTSQRVSPSQSSRASSDESPREDLLLATCKAFAISLNGSPKLVRLLIDPGSELTLVSSKIIDKLKLSRSPGNIPIQGVGSTSPGATQGQVSLVLQSTYSSSRVHLKAFILQKSHSIAVVYHIDILIGADNLRRVLKSSRLVMGGDSEPIAFHTRFGWAVLGATSNSSKVDPLKICHAISNDSLDKALTKFWVQEEVSSSPASTLTLAESQCEQHFVDTHSRLPTGRYMVRLPFSKDISTLGHSRSLAMRCLERLLKKFETDRNFKETYSGFLKEYESLGHMVPVPLDAPEPSQAFYLPHHGVWREQSSSTKLRVVFNGSAKSSTGISLNDLMHTGPKTQTDIFDVLLWITQHKYIFITDIVKMFRQIQVHPKDHDLQRILWVNESSQVQAYQLTSVTYGTRSAPYLACRILKQLVEDEGHNYPLAVNTILKGSYVDDISGGAETIDHLNAVASQLEDMCSSAVYHSTSGKKDVFTFHGTISFHQAVTKRIILSEVAQLFDPLGLLSPVVIKAKILMQRLWLEKVSWDDHLTPDIVHEWSQFRQHLSQLSVIETPRWINLSSKATSIQIHGFSDASQLAMAAVIYIVTLLPKTQIS